MAPRMSPKAVLAVAAALAVLSASVLVLRGKPVSVDVGLATRGPMRVAIEEE